LNLASLSPKKPSPKKEKRMYPVDKSTILFMESFILKIFMNFHIGIAIIKNRLNHGKSRRTIQLSELLDTPPNYDEYIAGL
jgi:hypothetical protein